MCESYLNLPESCRLSALAEEILTEGPGQIKALVTTAGNPVLSTPNGRELDRALASLEFMASIDFYINETTQARAHHPAADFAARTRTLRSGVSSAGCSQHRQVFACLYLNRTMMRNTTGRSCSSCKRAWSRAVCSAALKGKLMKRFLGPERILDLGLRFGPYGGKLNPFLEGIDSAES